MPSRAKAYIALVIASGALLLLLAAESWYSTYPAQFFIYLGLAAFASALKVRIPGLESNISPNFVFLLLGIVALPFSQVLAMSLVAALVQSLWAAKRPRLVQVAFNAAALVLTSGLAYKVCHITASVSGTASPVVCLILAGSLYFPLNSLLVSTAIGLVEGQPVKDVCTRCYEWVFPYFMLGIAFAGLMSGVYTPPAVWKGALVLLPTMVLTYVFFQNRSSRALPAMKLPTSLEEAEEPVEVG
jgi:hypothetical protein